VRAFFFFEQIFIHGPAQNIMVMVTHQTLFFAG
jgi:hypothetical protein